MIIGDLISGLSGLAIPGLVLLVGLVILAFMAKMGRLYVKVPPDKALLVYGAGRKREDKEGKPLPPLRIISGSAGFVIPILHDTRMLDLSSHTIEVEVKGVPCETGVRLVVDGVVVYKIGGDMASILTAAEQLLDKPKEQIDRMTREVMEGHLRAIIGTLTPEKAYRDREAFAQKVQEQSAPDLQNMGLQIVSFPLRNVDDEKGYYNALGVQALAEVERDAAMGKADAEKESRTRVAEANQEAREKEIAAETAIVEADRKLGLKKADVKEAVTTREQEAEVRPQQTRAELDATLAEKKVAIELARTKKQVEVSDQQIQVAEREQKAQKIVPAEAERDAKFATAEATQRMGEAEAAADKAKLLAVAEGTRARVEAQNLAEEQALKLELVKDLIVVLPEALAGWAAGIRPDELQMIDFGGVGSDGGTLARYSLQIPQAMKQFFVATKSLTGIDLEEFLLKKISEGASLEEAVTELTEKLESAPKKEAES